MRTHILKHIGLALLLVLPFWGCQRERLVQEESISGSETVRLTLDIDIPDYGTTVTKTDFTDTPTCNLLYVAVFDEADLLTEIVTASTSGSNFTVELHPSALPRTLHFLALPTGSPLVTDLASLSGSKIDETTFASKLATQNGDAACWARKYLQSGISGTTDLSGIKMVRNYAKVYIRNSENDTHFRLESFRVYNASKFGMAVPFIGTDLNNTYSFQTDLFPVFFNGEGAMRTYSDVHDTQGYRGYNHPSGVLRTPVTDDADTYNNYLTSNGTDDVYDYVFETRHNPEIGNNNAFILFKGKFDSSNNFASAPSTWYKADFVYADPASQEDWGEPDRIPYDILRNYAYVLTIEGVIGEGHATAEYAASQPARNNFEGSVVGIDISSVAEYTSALYLSQTAIELPRDPDITFIDLYYRNENPKGDPPTNTPNTYVRITASGDDILNDDIVNSDGTLNLAATGVVSEAIDASAPSIAAMHLKPGAWWHLRLPITISDSGTATLQQTISIKNKTGLSRHCVVSVRPHYPFEIVGYQQNPAIISMPEEKPAGGDVVRVNFQIPAGMPEALFPLEFKVESYADGDGPNGSTDVTRQVLQPNVAAIETYLGSLGSGDYRLDMPVSGNTLTIVGASAADNADLEFRSYHYIRTLSWAEYCLAVADANNMKTFPVFLTPQYNPRNSAEVSSLGNTTVWMRQGDRGSTYFSYRDDANFCTRRLAYTMMIVEPTRIVLPAGNETFDGKPVYWVQKGTPRNILVSVVRERNGAATSNPLTISKSATQFSLSPTSGYGSVNTLATVSRVTGERYLVNVHASTVQEGGISYGESDAQFYIFPKKGTREVYFGVDDFTVLRNHTVSSATSGSLHVDSNLQATCATLEDGEKIIYSLSNATTDAASAVTSNEYVEIVQTGSRYTLKGKSVNGATSVKIYAIVPESDNYDRTVDELNVHVKQGVISQNGKWWTGDTNGYVGALIPITDGQILYDTEGLYSYASRRFEDVVTFSSAKETVATVQSVAGVWNIIPRSAYASRVSLTMSFPGTDDNGDGIYGDIEHGDVFPATTFVQNMLVNSSWWKVEGDGALVNGGKYSISDGGDANRMTLTHDTREQGAIGGLLPTRFHYMQKESFTPVSYNDNISNTGKYSGNTTDNWFTITENNNIYTLRHGDNYLFPRANERRVFIYNDTEDYQGLIYDSESPRNTTTTECWVITKSGDSFFIRARVSGNPINQYINYNTTHNYFDCGGNSSNYVHLWRYCETLEEVIEATDFTYPAAP